MCCKCGPRSTKIFYDESPFTISWCSRNLCCVTGVTLIHNGPTRRICCCMDVPDCLNNCCECHFPSICGDRVSLTAGDSCFLCCPLIASPCTNFCGMCGPKTGQPLCKSTLFRCLKPGTGESFAEEINNARQKYRERTGIID